MLDKIFETIIDDSSISVSTFLICTAVSLVLGFVIALSCMYKSKYSKSYVLTVAILPAIVQVVIMLVNGDLGAGIAVAGAFSLVRFRSAPGNAREIVSIFLSMAVGLACGMGYVVIATVFTAIIILVTLLYSTLRFGDAGKFEKTLKITIPESLDYNTLFDDLFEEYTASAELLSVRTSNMGSLYQLNYRIILKSASLEKELIDKIRCRNGNLDISCGRIPEIGETL